MYRRSEDIERIIVRLADEHPSLVTRIQLTPSAEHRPISAIRLRSGDAENRRGILLVGGMHAREMLNPDLLIDMVLGLLEHHYDGTDWIMGGQTWNWETIELVLASLDIFVLPNANPDGREYALDTDRMWRKNRARLQRTPCFGVDPNRNFDILWGIETPFSTSLDPCVETYVGPQAFSEPESQNVRNLLNDYAIHCFVDVHSYSEKILHPWGHAPSQISDSSQRFTLVDTADWNLLPDDAPEYEEYILPNDLVRFRRVGRTAADAIRNVRGRDYTIQSIHELYSFSTSPRPTTGSSSDYVYSRHIADTSKRKVYGFSLETGPNTNNPLDSFQPDEPEQYLIAEEATSGLISIMTQCICAIEILGSYLYDIDISFEQEDASDELSVSAADALSAMRSVRDLRLAKTDAGREWVDMLSRHQLELASLVLKDKHIRKEGHELIIKVGEVLRNNSKFSQALAENVRSLIAWLGKRKISDGLRADLESLESIVGPAVGKHADEVIFDIAFTSPTRRKK